MKFRESIATADARTAFRKDPEEMIGPDLWNPLPAELKETVRGLDERELSVVARALDTVEDYGLFIKDDVGGIQCML